MATNTTKKEYGTGAFGKFLNFIEVVGNKLPHPVTIFVILALGIVVLSGILQKMGISVKYDAINRKTFEIVKDQTLTVKSLFNGDGFRYILNSMTKNFTGFAPLGTVLVAMIGVGVAEGTGLITSALRKLVLSTPPKLITAVIVFAGIMSNIASDAGYIVLVPLGAVIFLAMGRHPLAGMAAAFAGVSGGFSANLLVGTLDPLLGGISTEAVQLIPKLAAEGYAVLPTANYFFMAASTFLITFLGVFVTEKIVEPRLGSYEGEHSEEITDLTSDEKKGLKFALIATVVFAAVLAITTVPANAIFRDPANAKTFAKAEGNPESKLNTELESAQVSVLKGAVTSLGEEGGDLPKEVLKDLPSGVIKELRPLGHFLHDGIIATIMFFFLIPGVAYGIGAKTIKSDKDVAGFVSKSLGSMGGYLALAFAAAQFVNYFNYTNIGTIVAVKGADFLKAIGFSGIPLAIAFIIVAGFINLFMGSASAKWAIMAPVFIPMFYEMGFTPEFTQVIYRIGDSTTNIISPLMSYFPVIIAFFVKYKKDTGIGTVISMMLPYTIVFLSGWTIMLIFWSLLNLPIGPGIKMLVG